MQRTFLAALIGGAIVFGWGALSHTVLPLGHMGIEPMPAEIVSLLSAQMPEAGTYSQPHHDFPIPEPLPATMPTALLSWRPAAATGMGQYLAVEFASNVLAALVAALILCGSACGGSLLCRAGTVMGMGVFAWLSISASQWNWYGFSNGVFVGEGLDQAISWFLAGLAIAAIVKPKAAAAA
jgi:hypothetical protein